jgi:hypothetical protein
MQSRVIAGGCLGLAVVAMAGCGPVQAGAAAVVGDERFTDADVRGEVQDIREFAGEMGMDLDAGQRSELAAAVVSQWVFLRMIEGTAEEDGVDVGEEAVAQRVEELGGEDAFLAQGVPEDGIADEVMVMLVAEDALDPATEQRLTEEVTEDLREELLAQGEQMGLGGDDLEEQVEAALAQQGAQISAEVSRQALDERLQEFQKDTVVEVSSRYGVYDQEAMHIAPGVGELSALGPDRDAPVIDPLQELLEDGMPGE